MSQAPHTPSTPVPIRRCDSSGHPIGLGGVAAAGLAAIVASGVLAGVTFTIASTPTQMTGVAASVVNQDQERAWPIGLPSVNTFVTHVCLSAIAVQNVGRADALLALVVWDRGSPEHCAGPLKAECSGLLKPGSSWVFAGSQVPSGSASAIVYSFNADWVTDHAPSTAPNEPMASLLCSRLFFGVIGDCDSFASFHSAYLARTSEAEWPMDIAVGPPVHVTLIKHCPGPLPGSTASDGFAGTPLRRVDAADVYSATLFPVSTGSLGDLAPRVVVQNGGDISTTLTLAVRSNGEAWTPCDEAALQPGEAQQMSLQGCLQPGRLYAALVTSDQPLATVAEGMDGAGLLAAAGQAEAVTGPLWGALLPSPVDGWQSKVTVFNPLSHPAQTDVAWRRGAGETAMEQAAEICPGCVVEFVFDDPDWPETQHSGSVSVNAEYQAEPATVMAHFEARQAGAPHGDDAFSYALGPAVEGPGATLAMPLALFDPMGFGVTEIAVAHADPEAADLPLQVLIFDKNDLLAVQCPRLVPGGSRRILLEGRVPQGSLAAAVVTVPGALGGSFSAAALHTRTHAGSGDGASVARAIHLAGPPAIAGAPADLCLGTFKPVRRPDPVLDAEREHPLGMYHLPIVGSDQRPESCGSVVRVQVGGAPAARAILVTWSQPGFCLPQCAGPLQVECSGLLAPGSTWQFPSVPGALGGVVYGVTDAPLAPGGAGLAADALCELLPEFLEGDCDAYRVFASAFALGLAYRGVELGDIVHSDLTVTVARNCDDRTAEYHAITSSRFHPTERSGGRYVQALVPARTAAGLATTLYLQNGGLHCTTALVQIHADGRWQDQASCSVYTLPAGETMAIDLAGCAPDVDQGAIVVSSEEPLSVVAEWLSSEPLAMGIVRGRSVANPYDLNGDGVVDYADVARLEASLGSSAPPGGGPADPRWNEAADLNGDGVVDEKDLEILRRNLDPGVPTPTATSLHPTPEAPTPTTTPGPTVGRVFIPQAEKAR